VILGWRGRLAITTSPNNARPPDCQQDGIVSLGGSRPQDAGLPPQISEFLICVFVRQDHQEDRLADFVEKFQTVRLPRFGTRLAGAVYVALALWSAADILKIMALAAVADWIFRAWGAIADVVERIFRTLGW
jgi:hypothetical protein